MGHFSFSVYHKNASHREALRIARAWPQSCGDLTK
jgi:hypothetical protein